ncbi:MAG: hypothetical protein HDT44_00865 [Ruminococcaceae bacterium]|nr:hypothetical protein [Oscillospiraceae bacterium]
MKNLICLAVSAIIALSGCSASSDKLPAVTDENGAVLPPVRVLEDVSCHGDLARSYTFETAFSEAEVVARIKVGNWLYEDNDIMSTFFEAETLQCFKGDIPEKFILKQEGSSEWIEDSFPLFTYGNELLVFMSKGDSKGYESRYPKKYDTFYWLIGAYITFFDVSYDNNGNRYYADRYGFMGKTMNISSKDDFYSEVYEYAVKADPFLGSIRNKEYYYSYIFSEDDVISLMKSF